MPYGQAYRTKNSCLRISDPRFGPACWPSGLSSLVGWYDRCFPAEEVESAHWAARGVSVQKLIAVRPVLTPTVFTSLLRGSLAFWGQGSSLVSLRKVGTVMALRDLTHMMKQRKLVAHHHSYPLLRFRFQTSDVTAYRLLVRDVVALK